MTTSSVDRTIGRTAARMSGGREIPGDVEITSHNHGRRGDLDRTSLGGQQLADTGRLVERELVDDEHDVGPLREHGEQRGLGR